MEIRIIPGNEHEPRLIEAEHENDLFHDVFLQAENALNEIRSATEKYENTEAWDTQEDEERLYGFGSNLIAFCGERGQGKTSAMLSFARNLRSSGNRGDYLVLPTIDPTMLEDKDSILNVILARMFQKARDIWEDCRNRGTKPSEILQHELTECFQFCMEGIATNNSRKEKQPDEFSSLDQLEKLGDSARLKHNFEELAKRLLKFSGCSDKKGQIIIPIDDTDLQFQTAYNILEDLRKYLSIPHVVLLMALHMEQMRDLVEKQYSDYFGKQAIPATVRLRANRYMDKMFPAKHVIFLPRFEHFCRDSYRTLTLSYGEIIKSRPLQEGVLNFIYRKTGIIYVVPSSYLHNIIPSSLRGLSQLLNLLNAMEDIPLYEFRDAAITTENLSKLKESAAIALRNLQLFESYFLHEWCVDVLEPEHAKILASASMVALSIQLPKLYDDIYRDIIPKREEENAANAIDEIKKNNPWATSYSLLVKMLDEIALKRDSETYRFCFAVHNYITIQLHKLMWQTRDDVRLPEEEGKDVEKKPKEYLSYANLVDMLEGTLFLPARDQNHADDGLKKKFSYVNLRGVGKDSPELNLMTRKKERSYYFDYTRILCGALLKEAGRIVGDGKQLFDLQEACLMIVLNWDVQEQLRNLEVSKKEEPFIAMYSSLKRRLKIKNVDRIIDGDSGAVLEPVFALWKTLKDSKDYKKLFNKEKTINGLLAEKRSEIMEPDGETEGSPDEKKESTSGAGPE